MARFAKRTWGWYWTLIDRGKFKVKILRFWRRRSCSLQTHKLRSEVWLFLKGEGMFTKDKCPTTMKSGQYATVPRHVKHMFYAIRPTWVLEIQYGEKCEEKDITRYEL